MKLYGRLEFVLVLTALLASVVLLYPGLWGGFTLDDYPNLQGLAHINEQGFLNYVLAGVAGGAGRAISYFSFALQASSWPDNPFPFKLVNLTIHLVNIILVYVLVRQLILRNQDKSQAGFIIIPVVIATLWGIHPLQISSVFYVVQRMTLLSSTFVLLSCCLYLWIRNTSIKNPWGKYCLLTVAIGAGYFGVFAKEGAALVGLFICLLEWFSRRKSIETPRVSTGWLFIFCVAPVILLFIYLGFKGHYTSGYFGRNFTLGERLLTESRVLWDYVGRILLPTASSINFYNDDVVISRSLTSPISTVWAIFAWLLLIAATLAFRRKAPLVFLGIFWFLIGHLLESTVLPLEISFEHRNYVPMLGWLLVVTGILIGSYDWMRRNSLETKVRAIRLGLGAVVVIWTVNLIAVARVEALTWGDPWKFAVAGLTDRPQSLRARQGMADVLSAQGNYKAAAELLWQTDKELGPITGIYLQMELMRCFDPSIEMPTPDEMRKRLLTGPRDLSSDAVEQIWSVKTAGGCEKLSWDQYREYLQYMMTNPNFRGFDHAFVRLRAYSFNSEERYQEAAMEMERLPEERVSVGYVIIKARFQGIAGNYDEAVATIERLKKRLLQQELKYEKALEFVQKLEQEIKERISETAISEGGQA